MIVRYFLPLFLDGGVNAVIPKMDVGVITLGRENFSPLLLATCYKQKRSIGTVCPRIFKKNISYYSVEQPYLIFCSRLFYLYFLILN